MILRNTSATISATLTIDGAEADPSPDTATVSVSREDGTELVAETAAADGGTGAFTYQLTPAETVQVDELRAEWKMSVGGEEQILTTYHSVVGGFLCSLSAISEAVVVGGRSAPSTEELRARRSEVERLLEDACGVAFRPRYARDTLRGEGCSELLLRHPKARQVLAASIAGEDLDVDELELVGDFVRRSAGWTRDSVISLAYEHGWERPPEPITRAAIALASFYFENSSDRVSRFREDDQEVWLTVAGIGSAETSIPEVNQAIHAYRFPSIA